MTTVASIDRYLAAVERVILSIAMLGMVAIIVANVVSRVFFSYSWAATEEFGTLLLLVITFIGISYATRYGRHITMSALQEFLPDSMAVKLQRFVSFVTAAVMLGLGVVATEYIIQIGHSGDTTNVLRIPLYMPYVIVPIGFFLAGLRYVGMGFQPDRPIADDA